MDQILELSIFQKWGGWIAQVFLVVFVALLLDMLQRKSMQRIKQRVRTTKNLWDDTLVDSGGAPLSAMIWLIGIIIATFLIERATGTTVFSTLAPVRDVAVISVIGWFLFRLIENGKKNLLSYRAESGIEVDHNTVEAVTKLLRASLLITIALVILQTLGFSISGVLAFGGIGGIAVGFAAKDLLANFFGGVMIYLDRPFVVGDWIRSPDRNIEGTVEHIGWRLTRVRTFDKRPIYVPNSVFNNIVVENPQRMTHRRIYETIGIRYEDVDKMGAITERVKRMLVEHPAIEEKQTLMVNFNTFSASSLDFFVYTFTHTTNWVEFHEIKHEILLAIHDIIADEGAEVAFPTSTIHLADRASGEYSGEHSGTPMCQ